MVTFRPGAIRKPLLISCSLWNPRTFSPPLGSNELLVSNVIQLSHDGLPDLEFSGDPQGSVTVALMHSASNFKGYEVVIKQLVDPENNEWIDLATSTFWHTSGIALNQMLGFWYGKKRKKELKSRSTSGSIRGGYFASLRAASREPRAASREPRAASREPRAASLFLRAPKDSCQKIQKMGIMP